MNKHRPVLAILAGAALLLLAHLTAQAATTIEISGTAIRTNVQRFGINLAQHNYYDSGQMMKELLFRNPGFEGLLFQSVVRLGPGGTATNAIEDQPLGTWPSGFWNGGNYHIIWSGAAPTAKDRQGVISQHLAPYRPTLPDNPTGIPPSDPNGSTSGATYVFADTGTVVAAGDYLLLSKTFLGGTGGGAAYGSWDIAITNGGAVTTEQADLPPHIPDGLPAGQQCARLTALAADQQASIRGVFDTLQGFIRLNHTHAGMDRLVAEEAAPHLAEQAHAVQRVLTTLHVQSDIRNHRPHLPHSLTDTGTHLLRGHAPGLGGCLLLVNRKPCHSVPLR